MDSTFLIEYRQRLKQIIKDPNNNILYSFKEKDIPTHRSSGLSRQFISISELFRNRDISEEFYDALALTLKQIYNNTSFSALVFPNERDDNFVIDYVKEKLLKFNMQISLYSIDRKELHDRIFTKRLDTLAGKRSVIFSNIFVTGYSFASMVQAVLEFKGIPVSMLCSIRYKPSSINNMINSISPSMIALDGFSSPLPLYSLTDFPLDDPGLSERMDSDFYENIYRSQLADQSRISRVFSNINSELKTYLSRHPEMLYSIPSRRFEELIASILEDRGFKVELTRAVRDGGRDIIAYLENPVINLLIYVECKKYSPNHKVGVEIIRAAYGVQNIHGPNKTLIVTTSFFTRGAIELARQIGHQMELKDYENLKDWLSRYG